MRRGQRIPFSFRVSTWGRRKLTKFRIPHGEWSERGWVGSFVTSTKKQQSDSTLIEWVEKFIHPKICTLQIVQVCQNFSLIFVIMKVCYRWNLKFHSEDEKLRLLVTVDVYTIDSMTMNFVFWYFKIYMKIENGDSLVIRVDDKTFNSFKT